MIKSLALQGVGPAPELKVDFAPRVNVLTGDNGLGKSFLLDIVWWALSQKWSGHPAWPRRDALTAEIEICWTWYDETSKNRFEFGFREQEWLAFDSVLARSSALAIYIRADGGFSLWDPFRETAVSQRSSSLGHRLNGKEPAVYQFDAAQIWDGLRFEGASICEGVERDWVKWQEGQKPEFERLVRALSALAPPDEPLQPGRPMRVFLGEGFDRPTISTNAGEVPLVLASAGIRRVIALAYLLVWSISEHLVAARLTRREPLDRVVILIDEPETHLHPKWQRTILPSILSAIGSLSDFKVQMIAATHSPLVLASLEPSFDPDFDGLVDLRLEEQRLRAVPIDWRRRGDVNTWLTSEVFDLKSARSLDAEKALEEAAGVLSTETPDPERARAVDQRLRALLGDLDPFWIRWRHVGEKQGWLE
jgi:AAA domain, putative AbiEii toxin, Type IV TA system